MKISHTLENLTDTQKSHLETAQVILDSMNSLVEDKNSFSYNGRTFSLVVFGDESIFLNKLLNFVSKDKLDDSIDYIIEEVNKEVRSSNSTPTSQKNLTIFKRKISDFLKNFPMISLSLDNSEKLVDFIKELDS